jgi:hypothetical protein
MVQGERFTVHGIGEQRFGRASLVETKTALERNRLRVAVNCATICTAEYDVLSVRTLRQRDRGLPSAARRSIEPC